jgi:serine/threonine protein kinase
LTPERWERVEALFHEALNQPPGERRTFLEQACAADARLLHEVLELLRAHEGPGPLGQLDAPAPSAPHLEWVGPYRLVRRIGEGGMGAVYLAERVGEGFTQRVALKLIRAGYADPQMKERLAAERRILARLEHPGIARLIDGGSTPGGQPFYAMEFVEGSDLLRYCDDHGVPLRGRLKLFIQVCAAVHYAHQQLVVHRDLKPGNIMVTPDGRPKLLDFGLAKLLERDAGRDATQTAPWLTPAYVSPEQLLEGRVSTLTDVYALGVVLYELVAGRRPYDVEGLNPAELTRVVCEEVPPPPSTVVSSGAAFGTSPHRLRRRVAGDLDVIVLKALAKDPGRRYASVAELADDIRRYLEGQPVIARPDSLMYRASKLVQRHKPSVAAAAAVLVFLVGGLGAAVWQAREASVARKRAEAALHQSRDVSEFLLGLFDTSDPDAVRGDTVAGRALLRRGVEEVELLDGQPVIQARMLITLGRVDENLGRYDDAMALYRRALEQRRAALGPKHIEVAENLDRLGELDRRMGRYHEADSLYHAALDMKRDLLGASHRAVAQTLYLLGFLMPYLGRMEESEQFYREALAIQRRTLTAVDPELSETMIQLATILSRRAKPDEAERLLREALAIRGSAYGPDGPLVADAKTYLADFLHRVREEHAEAERLYREAIAVHRRSPEAGINQLTHAIEGLAGVAEELGRYGEAETLLREIVEERRARLGPAHPSVANGLAGLTDFLHRRGRLAEAETLNRREIAILRASVGMEHHAVATALGRLGTLLSDEGRYREADSVFGEAIAMRERVSGPRHPLLALVLADYAHSLTTRARYADAEAALAKALDIVERQYPDAHPDAQRVIRGLVELYERWHRPAEAARYRARVRAVGPGV